MVRRIGALSFLLAACSPSPQPHAASASAPSKAQPAASAEATAVDAGDAAADAAGAASEDSGAEATDAPAYQPPPPIVIRRHHVFTTLVARAGKRLRLTSLLTTSADDQPDVEPGTEAVLQTRAKGSPDWTAVATVKVVSLATKGNRATGNERQEIVLDLTSEEPGHKAVYVRGAKLRLEIDRHVEQQRAH